MELYDYQIEVRNEAYDIIKEHMHVYLALEMRFGKTPITLDMLTLLPVFNVLLVTTKSAISGIKEVADKLHVEEDYDLEIINYESLHKTKRAKYDAVVLDESHANLSSFPKPTKRLKELSKLDWEYTVWLSGTPAIESSSQLFHQLSLSKYHPFSEYRNFYAWHKDFGIQGLTIYTGGPRNAVDYSQTVDFSEFFEPVMIRRTLEDAKTSFIRPKIEIEYVDLPDHLREIYDEMWRHSIIEIQGEPVTANNAAAKYSKCQQIVGGTVIDDNGDTHILSPYRTKYTATHIDKDTVVFYKYRGEFDMLKQYIPEKQLYQIDSACTGIDMSHFEKMWIYSLTYSGSNFTQVLSRLINVNRDTVPEVKILVARNTVDEKVVNEVFEKKNQNDKFLRSGK